MYNVTLFNKILYLLDLKKHKIPIIIQNVIRSKIFLNNNNK